MRACRARRRSASTASARWSPAPGAASGLRPPRRWREAGAHVTLVARTRDEIEAAAAAIRARGRHGGRAGARRHRSRRRARRRSRRAEPFDILVNNAGTNRPKPFARRHGRGLRRRHRPQRARGLLRRAGGGAAADRGGAARLDHQHLLADGPCRRARSRTRLLRHQARDGGLHQGDGDRARAAQHPRQHARPDLHRDADDASRSSRTRRSATDVLSKIKLGRLGQSRTSWARSCSSPPTPRR